MFEISIDNILAQLIKHLSERSVDNTSVRKNISTDQIIQKLFLVSRIFYLLMTQIGSADLVKSAKIYQSFTSCQLILIRSGKISKVSLNEMIRSVDQVIQIYFQECLLKKFYQLFRSVDPIILNMFFS